VQVREQDLPRPQHRALDRLRLLDLHDHVGRREDVGGACGDRRAFARVVGVVHADADARVVLDDDRMPVVHELADRPRRQADAVFEDLDLLRHADAHGFSREIEMRARLRAPPRRG